MLELQIVQQRKLLRKDAGGNGIFTIRRPKGPDTGFYT